MRSLILLMSLSLTGCEAERESEPVASKPSLPTKQMVPPTKQMVTPSVKERQRNRRLLIMPSMIEWRAAKMVVVATITTSNRGTNKKPPNFYMDVSEVLRGEFPLGRAKAAWGPSTRRPEEFAHWNNTKIFMPGKGSRMILGLRKGEDELIFRGRKFRPARQVVDQPPPVVIARLELTPQNRRRVREVVEAMDQFEAERAERKAEKRRRDEEAWRNGGKTEDVAQLAIQADVVVLAKIEKRYDNGYTTFNLVQPLKGNYKERTVNGLSSATNSYLPQDLQYLLFLIEKQTFSGGVMQPKYDITKIVTARPERIEKIRSVERSRKPVKETCGFLQLPDAGDLADPVATVNGAGIPAAIFTAQLQESQRPSSITGLLPPNARRQRVAPRDSILRMLIFDELTCQYAVKHGATITNQELKGAIRSRFVSLDQFGKRRASEQGYACWKLRKERAMAHLGQEKKISDLTNGLAQFRQASDIRIHLEGVSEEVRAWAAGR